MRRYSSRVRSWWSARAEVHCACRITECSRSTCSGARQSYRPVRICITVRNWQGSDFQASSGLETEQYPALPVQPAACSLLYWLQTSQCETEVASIRSASVWRRGAWVAISEHRKATLKRLPQKTISIRCNKASMRLSTLTTSVLISFVCRRLPSAVRRARLPLDSA